MEALARTKTPHVRARVLTPKELAKAGELIALTNDDAAPDELTADLTWCYERWPQIHVGAFDERGELIGAIAGRLDRNDPKRGWSDDLVVVPHWRSANVGRLLLQAQLDGFRQLGCERVRGRSPRRLFQSFGFFQRHGFKVIEETVAQGIWGIADGEPLWITERRLTGDVTNH